MPSYSTFEIETGRIGARGYTDGNLESIQAGLPEGRSAILGAYDPTFYYIVNNKPIKRPIIPDFTISGSTFRFASKLPGKTIIHVFSETYDTKVEADHLFYSLETEESGVTVFIYPPWPTVEDVLFLNGGPTDRTAPGQILQSVSRVKEMILQRINSKIEDVFKRFVTQDQNLMHARRGIHARSLRDMPHESDTRTIAEISALSNHSPTIELNNIFELIAFEDWVLLRTHKILEMALIDLDQSSIVAKVHLAESSLNKRLVSMNQEAERRFSELGS